MGVQIDPSDLPALIRVNDVARWLGIQPVRVRQLILRGYLKASKPPGMRDYLIRKADVEAYLAEGERLVEEQATTSTEPIEG